VSRAGARPAPSNLQQCTHNRTHTPAVHPHPHQRQCRLHHPDRAAQPVTCTRLPHSRVLPWSDTDWTPCWHALPAPCRAAQAASAHHGRGSDGCNSQRSSGGGAAATSPRHLRTGHGARGQARDQGAGVLRSQSSGGGAWLASAWEAPGPADGGGPNKAFTLVRPVMRVDSCLAAAPLQPNYAVVSPLLRTVALAMAEAAATAKAGARAGASSRPGAGLVPKLPVAVAAATLQQEKSGAALEAAAQQLQALESARSQQRVMTAASDASSAPGGSEDAPTQLFASSGHLASRVLLAAAAKQQAVRGAAGLHEPPASPKDVASPGGRTLGTHAGAAASGAAATTPRGALAAGGTVAQWARYHAMPAGASRSPVTMHAYVMTKTARAGAASSSGSGASTSRSSNSDSGVPGLHRARHSRRGLGRALGASSLGWGGVAVAGEDTGPSDNGGSGQGGGSLGSSTTGGSASGSGRVSLSSGVGGRSTKGAGVPLLPLGRLQEAAAMAAAAAVGDAGSTAGLAHAAAFARLPVSGGSGGRDRYYEASSAPGQLQASPGGSSDSGAGGMNSAGSTSRGSALKGGRMSRSASLQGSPSASPRLSVSWATAGQKKT